MMNLTSESTIGAIAAEHPGAIRVFQRHEIDYCCGGGRTLVEISVAQNLPLEPLLAELAEAASENRPGEPILTNAPIAELLAHILARYHSWLWRELPRLAGMADRVLQAHGGRHPESVPGMHRLFGALRADLEPHMAEEEDVVFPALVALDLRRAAGRPEQRDARIAAIDADVARLTRQHETVGELLRQLRQTTGGFTPPEDACNTFRGLLHGLADLEREVHEHVHLENNVLFPTVASLLERRSRSAPAVD